MKDCIYKKCEEVKKMRAKAEAGDGEEYSNS